MRRRLLLVPLVVVAACSRPLPEEGTASADLYRRRCGTCHRAYSPAATRFATWEMILPRMEGHIARAGLTRLTPDERAEIVAYLRRHSG